MKAILDTMPPLPYTEAIRKLDGDEWAYSTDQDFANPEKFGWERVYTADQLREDRRIVAEHVVRMCAEVCDQHASIEGIAQQCAAEIRALLKT
jgi:hypothetical protein